MVLKEFDVLQITERKGIKKNSIAKKQVADKN